MPADMEPVQQNGIDVAPPPVGAVITEALETKQPEPDWESADDSDLRAIFKKNNPERDDNGQFASDKSVAEVKTDLPETKDQAQAKPAEQLPAAITPPQSWSAEMKEVFPTLPPAAQEFIAKRESEAQTKITQQGQELSQFEPINAVLEQHRDIFERNGLDYGDGLGRLLSAERLLEQNPVAAIAQIAEAYGVDLRQYSGQQQPQDSAATALHQRIAQLESQLNNTSTRIEQREAAEAETQRQAVLTTIETFAKDKPDWAELENDVHAEIVGIKAAIAARVTPAMQPAEILTKAYERAQRNNPAAWERKQATEKAAAEKTRAEQAAKDAEDAKRNKKVNVASSPANGRTVTTMDDTLRQTYRKTQTG